MTPRTIDCDYCEKVRKPDSDNDEDNRYLAQIEGWEHHTNGLWLCPDCEAMLRRDRAYNNR